jgi:hypothetical protein
MEGVMYMPIGGGKRGFTTRFASGTEAQNGIPVGEIDNTSCYGDTTPG